MREPPAPHDPDGKVMTALLAACPSFTDAWSQLNSDFPQTDGRGAYIEVGEFARHLVKLLDRGQSAEFEAVFRVGEQLLQDPDDSVRYVTKVGLLEDVANIASNTRGWPFAARFRAWSGPATLKAWDELHSEWGQATRAAELRGRGRHLDCRRCAHRVGRFRLSVSGLGDPARLCTPMPASI